MCQDGSNEHTSGSRGQAKAIDEVYSNCSSEASKQKQTTSKSSLLTPFELMLPCFQHRVSSKEARNGSVALPSGRNHH
ncbi:unnamed protein product [Calypogeia fissa]